MSSQHTQQDVNSVEKFPVFEKVLLAIGFYGVIILGIFGILRESVAWGLTYIGFLIFGFLVLFGYCICRHCPYPYIYSECLFPPFGQLIKRMYKFHPEPLTVIEKIGVFIITAGMVIIPQYWLLKNHISPVRCFLNKLLQ